jgi:hypothetical protein
LFLGFRFVHTGGCHRRELITVQYEPYLGFPLWEMNSKAVKRIMQASGRILLNNFAASRPFMTGIDRSKTIN